MLHHIKWMFKTNSYNKKTKVTVFFDMAYKNASLTRLISYFL